MKLAEIYKTLMSNFKRKSIENKERFSKDLNKPMHANAMMHLNLYKTGTVWAFDDAKHNISKEPFVLGMSEIISSYLH